MTSSSLSCCTISVDIKSWEELLGLCHGFVENFLQHLDRVLYEGFKFTNVVICYIAHTTTINVGLPVYVLITTGDILDEFWESDVIALRQRMVGGIHSEQSNYMSAMIFIEKIVVSALKLISVCCYKSFNRMADKQESPGWTL